MEVSARTFSAQLRGMLQKLPGCHFVAMDLEFSGLQTANAPRSVESLQDRYTVTKSAADRFSIVQVGFTIVHEDTESGGYVAYPYNMYLNPVVQGNLEVYRVFSMTSKAGAFLLEHGFQMHGLFLEGVSYLSRAEADEARQNEINKQSKVQRVPDIELQPSDTELTEFLDRSNKKIEQWIGTEERPTELVIGNDLFQSNRPPSTGLNNTEKRLLHQLVRNEWPGLTSVAYGGKFYIRPYQEDQDRCKKAQIEQNVNERIDNQIGIRWFVEALCAGPIQKPDAVSFINWGTHHPAFVDEDEAKKEFSILCDAIERTNVVLVGHNVFTDLVFLYRTFIGPLPEGVGEFSRTIHKMFPRVIDTKYMATKENLRRVGSSLSDVDSEYASQTMPKIEIRDPNFTKYLNVAPLHEAGFDSFVTARILVRISAYLHATGETSHSEKREASGGPNLRSSHSWVRPLVESTSSTIPDGSLLSHNIFGWTVPSQNPPQNPPQHQSGNEGASFKNNSYFADLLELESSRPEGQSSTLIRATSHPPASSADDPKYDQGSAVQPANSPPPPPPGSATDKNIFSQAEGVQIRELMPGWDSTFWHAYGNRLRVFGSIELELDLGRFSNSAAPE